jgi:threonine dehydrogenase-like Zn-dependent dehydrogenase
MRAGRIIAVDTIPSRLEMARNQGAEVIDYEKEDPVATIKKLTGGIGVDRVIDAVGIDANRAHHGPAAKETKKIAKQLDKEVEEAAPEPNPDGDNWQPGDGPSQVLRWAVECVAKAGTLAIIGVYGDSANAFPIGTAVEKNLTIKMGNCNHRRYVVELIEMVRMGRVDPTAVLTQQEPLASALDAYKAFDKREAGWTKVELKPSGKNGKGKPAERVV